MPGPKNASRVGRHNDKRDARSPRRDLRHEHREETRDRSLTYGLLPVLEALRAGRRRVEKLVIAEGGRDARLHELLETARVRGIRVERVGRDELSRLAGASANHQGVVAVIAAGEYTDADEILNGAADPPLFLLLDGIEDPRNLGAALRTAECVGVDGVFVPERRAVGLTETVAKSSAGASEYVKIAKVGNLNRLIEVLKERNIWVIGASADAVVNHSEWDWTRPSALVLGSEGRGLHRLIAENCDVLVKVPMYGKIQSLNVSVAAGVILFEARRQRQAAAAVKERS